MPHQDLIDYQNQLKQINIATIATYNQTIGSLNDAISQANSNIDSYNAQITDTNSKITNLENGNDLIDQTIAILSQ